MINAYDLYAFWIFEIRHQLQISKWKTLKVAGKAHNNYKGGLKPSMLPCMVTKLLHSYCGTHLVESYYKTHCSTVVGWNILFHHIWSKLWWVYDVVTGTEGHLEIILRTWMSQEQEELFENSKQHFFHADYLFVFYNVSGRKDAGFIIAAF